MQIVEKSMKVNYLDIKMKYPSAEKNGDRSYITITKILL